MVFTFVFILFILVNTFHSSSTTTFPVENEENNNPSSTVTFNIPTETTSSRFINRIERNTDGKDDGRLNTAEIEQYIRSVVGGEHFDSATEVQEATTNALSNIDKVDQLLPDDVNKERTITTAELRTYWKSLKTLSTPDEVAEWVIHSLQLPQYARNFRKNSVTGFDLPLLLQDQGSMFLELNIKSPLHRRMFERAINMRLFGLSNPPGIVANVKADAYQCDGLRISWDRVIPKGGIKVHRYLMVAAKGHDEGVDMELYLRSSIYAGLKVGGIARERVGTEGGGGGRQGDVESSLPPHEIKIFSGETRSKIFKNLIPGETYTFRVRAFNALGGGP